jgi:phospholipid/cholesterol/gamma-HCH transport system ATP-binding protein
MSEPKIRIRGLRKAFGNNLVLDGLDLDVAEGHSQVVIGASGSGKSVLLKCILGLLRPDEGTIEIDGRDVVGLGGRALDEVRAKFGMLFQSAALFDSLNLWENVAFGLVQGKGLSRRKAREIAMERLAEVGIGEELSTLYPAEISGGMRKQVGLARAIATEPEILFFDEPTTGLDPIMGDLIDKLIRKCTRELGATGLSITHDMASARRISDRMALIYRGKVIWNGPTAEMDTSGNAFVEQFIEGRTEGPIEVDFLQEHA